MTDPVSAAYPAPVRANGAFMVRHPAHVLALGFGSGLSPVAPGTVGTLWAWLAFLAITTLAQPTDLQWGLLIAASLLAGWWASVVTARNLGVADPGAVVIDEIAAFWLVLWLLAPAGWATQLVAFGLFRFSTRPSPARWAGPTGCSRALAGAAPSASCSTTWWPPSARCWRSPPGVSGSPIAIKYAANY